MAEDLIIKLKQLLADPNANPQELLALGDQLLQAQVYEAAEAGYYRVFQQSQGQSLPALFGLGVVYVRTFKAEAAQQCFEVILKQQPDHAEAATLYLYSLRILGRNFEVIRFFEQLKNPMTLSFYHYHLALLETGQVHRFLDQDLASIEQQLGPQHPYFADYQKAKGQAYQAIAHYSQSQSCYQQAIQLNPENPNVWQELIRTVALQHSSFSETYQALASLQMGLPPENWLHYQIARYHRVDENFKDEPIHLLFNDDYSLLYTATSQPIEVSQQSSSNQYKRPKLSLQNLKQSFKKIKDSMPSLINAGVFDLWQSNITAIKEKYAPAAADPYFVTSTGRCGTDALYQLLSQSENLLPYHTLSFVLSPGDRNHLLYRILSDQLDADHLTRFYQLYLQCRCAEMMVAYRQNKVPVFVNHWDTVFAPLNAVFFSNARFFKIYRQPEQVYQSMRTKNQWRNRQLQHWSYDAGFPEQQFVYYQDESLALEAEMAWYFYLTDIYSDALSSLVAPDQWDELDMSLVFKGDESAITKIREFFSLSLDTPTCQQHFSKKVNAKDDMKVEVADLEAKKERVREYWEMLEKEGGFL